MKKTIIIVAIAVVILIAAWFAGKKIGVLKSKIKDK